MKMTIIRRKPGRRVPVRCDRSERSGLQREDKIDDAVVIDIELAVVVEIAVVPAADAAERDVEIDLPVVVDVDLAVEGGVAGPGVFDDDGGGVDGFVVEQGGLHVADAE